MGIFKGIEQAKTSEGGSYFSPGKYAVMVNRIKHDVSRTKRAFVAVECVAVESNTTDPKPGMPAAMWADCSWDGFLNIMKDFAVAAAETQLGEPVDESEIDEAALESYVSEEQPLAGIFLGLTVLPPKAGRKFCPHRWSVLDAKELKRVEAAAKALGISSSKAA